MKDRTEDALALLTAGKSRDEAAKETGFRSFRALDMYFRRRGYRWNKEENTYVLWEESLEKDEDFEREVASFKPQQIISLLCMPGKDPREAAKQAGFRDIQKMADFMAGLGYVWDSEEGNYSKKPDVLPEQEGAAGSAVVTLKNTALPPYERRDASSLCETPVGGGLQGGEIAQYLPLLDFLHDSKDALIDLITISQTRKIPRYTLTGSAAAKSLQLPISLDKLMKNYSKEHNISQKDMFTVAMVEFLIKYGYEIEIEYLLSCERA